MAENTPNQSNPSSQMAGSTTQNQNTINHSQNAEGVLKKYTPEQNPTSTTQDSTAQGSTSQTSTTPDSTTQSSKEINEEKIKTQFEVMTGNLEKMKREAKEKDTQQKAAQLGMNYINIAITPINPDLLKIIPAEIAETNLIFPFYRLGKKLRVTMAHPTNAGALRVMNDLKGKGYLINTNLSSEDGIKDALQIYHSSQYRPVKKIATGLDESKLQTYEKELVKLQDLGEKVKGITAEEAVYMICIAGVKAGASDIHLEAEEHFVRGRIRIDGMLHEVFTINHETFINISSQIKYQSKMRINVSNVPQDGRFNFTVNQRKIDVRVSALPTEFGESFVFRLLDSSRKLLSFEELGFTGFYLNKVIKLTNLSHGMILVTGPTGSGKTTSLYSMLSKFNKPEVKIITMEDPIEYHLPGINQSQIDEKHGYDFASGLRSVLRQDPEVIMIGEIRDLATAETAAQAALTGHVMLSTLHTNSAIETIPRLINIGLPAFMIAPSLHTIIAQRLARRICPNCAVKKPVLQSERDEIEKVLTIIRKVRPSEKHEMPAELPQIVGCDVCSHTGYKGQVTLLEMLEVDFEMKDLILNKTSTTKMIGSARTKGMITIREDGILKVLAGITTLEEVHRSTNIM